MYFINIINIIFLNLFIGIYDKSSMIQLKCIICKTSKPNDNMLKFCN